VNIGFLTPIYYSSLTPFESQYIQIGFSFSVLINTYTIRHDLRLGSYTIHD
jgi:hypothetical protein